MILSNSDILAGLDRGLFSIDPLADRDPSRAPFNTSSIDLRLANQIVIPTCDASPVGIDLRKGGISAFWARHCQRAIITEHQPFELQPGMFLLGQTLERVSFPLQVEATSYSARVEGRSSFARCGILVHFTAPTIHAGFAGQITLEITNLGPLSFLLFPGLSICQLVIEEVRGRPVRTPSQFLNQSTPEGNAANARGVPGA